MTSLFSKGREGGEGAIVGKTEKRKKGKERTLRAPPAASKERKTGFLPGRVMGGKTERKKTHAPIPPLPSFQEGGKKEALCE